MRRIDWEEPLSSEDKNWLRQSGMPLVEDRIAANEQRFSVSEDADDTEDDEEPEGDDYEERTKAELAREVSSRKPEPEVEGNGNKADLIAALRRWDAEYGE